MRSAAREPRRPLDDAQAARWVPAGREREVFAPPPSDSAIEAFFARTLETHPRPYIERSPSSHARSLHRPVLVHAADNDQDVFIVENRILRDSMVAAGKDTAGLYTYREWHDPPGGHSFGVLDTPEGRESWRETVAFLARRLGPGRRPRE